MATYDVGDTVRLQGAFAVSGTATAPSTITLYVRTPDGVSTSYTSLTNSTTGTYYKDYTITMPEEHWWGFQGTGTVATYEEQSFDVRKPRATT